MYCPKCAKKGNRKALMQSKFAINNVVVHQCPSCMNIESEFIPSGEVDRQKVAINRA